MEPQSLNKSNKRFRHSPASIRYTYPSGQRVPLPSDLETICSAIEYEGNLSGKPLDWAIISSEPHGRLWKIFVEPAMFNSQLDESLEGAAAWWPGPPKGSADVLSVVPEELQINLRYATAHVPSRGRIRIYPIRFLDKLADAWRNPLTGTRFLDAYERLKSNVSASAFLCPSPQSFPELRTPQRESFKLLRHPLSFLWGPPGTGKTHTLGAMLAAFLVENPSARVLLLSTTNTAVDLALINVDKALDRLARVKPSAGGCRNVCKRIGAHFFAQHYRGREHLLPRPNELLVEQLALLEANRPDAGDLGSYDLWKSKVEELRDEMRMQAKEVLRSCRLAALTCTRGIFSYADLAELAPYDLVVFDEASQVGLAHALPFLPLAPRALFAGDPKQMEPIIYADDFDVKQWLGRSPFEFMRSGEVNTTILTEQSRMVTDICRVVAQTFYDGKLKVCPKAASDPNWKAERRLKNIPKLSDEPLCCIDITSEGKYHPFFKGFIRDESAERIVEHVQWAVFDAHPSEIAVLTPYRAQRTLIRKALAKAGIKGVQVSTVHRAQGSERKTIFFDPVLGTHQALSDRLINVALSRAKARLVVALSPGDLANPRLAQIRTLMKLDIAESDALPLGQFLRSNGVEKITAKPKVAYKGKLYIFEGFDPSGEKMMLRECLTGQLKQFQRVIVLAQTEVASAPEPR